MLPTKALLPPNLRPRVRRTQGKVSAYQIEQLGSACTISTARVNGKVKGLRRYFVILFNGNYRTNLRLHSVANARGKIQSIPESVDSRRESAGP